MQLPDKMRLDIAIDVNYNIVSKVALFQVPSAAQPCLARPAMPAHTEAGMFWLCLGSGL